MISFFLIALSFLCVTFGQPSGHSLFCILTSVAAFGLFFRTICSFSSKNRFLAGFLFFFCVQAVQLFWFTSHPFLYIWGVYLLLCLLLGLQFGLLALAASKRILSSHFSWLMIPALWVMMEWSRLFWFSGFCFNFAGLSSTDNIFTLQMASLGGMLGLSFWVMLTNTAFSRLLLLKTKNAALLFCAAAIIPYLFGMLQLNIHTKEMLQYDKEHPPLTCLIVHQRVLPTISGSVRIDPIKKAFHQWKEIITAIGPHRKEKVDLLLTPEGSVLFGNASLIFARHQVQLLFLEHLHYFPYFSDELLCSEDIAQELAKHFHCAVIMGLEGSDRYQDREKNRYFNSAFFFTNERGIAPRYDKQILVPMGEYLPFAWAKDLVSDYGVFGSFTPGTRARLFESGPHKIGSSICYEETFSNLIRQNSSLGATVLVNLTDDYWFPNSKLAIQHFDHARARTVENGIPLFRSCNFGISGAVDSLGRIVTALEAPQEPSSFIASCSSYHYHTLYSSIGDAPLIILCCVLLLLTSYRRFNGI